MEKPHPPLSPPESERPLSHGTASVNAPANESMNVPVRESTANGTGVGDTSHVDAVPRGEPADYEGGPGVFFLATLGVALIAWLVTLISQAVVAATVDNALVRILWFGFLVQTALIGIVFMVWIDRSEFNAAVDYALQISVFASIATVFAVVGVDRNIYSSRSSQQATGAGWLLTAIVDLLWIIYFTSPRGSPVFMVTNSMGGAAFRRASTTGPVTKIARSSGAFAMRPLHGGNAGGQRNTTGTIQGSEVVGKEAGAGAPAVEGKPAAAPDASPNADINSKWRAEALFDYKANENDANEISFKKGDVLLIFNMDSKWWEAKASDGRKGIVPSNYLRLLE
ncbi:hypothetical protein BDN70DRAFT_924695 [Pholiota conissans]|uniref:SH3 domain-containing protein n=1 Tax=Pholiota conissans TaxID=109636 RepID=A0A9P5YRQ2_9AGAR|nr:hypothetical protein BDN70DRAFT_924695 [Pholiota conissans]